MTSNKLLPLWFGLVAAVGMILGYRMADQESKTPVLSAYELQTDTIHDYLGIGRVEEVIRLLKSRYVDSVNAQFLEDVAIHAIMNELDPHSLYVEPHELEQINNRMNGLYKGIGIETLMFTDTLRVIRVLKDSPAERSGFEFGDKIIKINDTLIAGQGMDETTIRGYLKSSNHDLFEIIVQSKNNNPKTVTIEPQPIHVPNVDVKVLDDSILYIKIHRFTSDVSKQFIQALDEFHDEKHIPSLILDLRNNPGGYLPEATKILDQLFIENERLFVFTKGLNAQKAEYKSSGRPFFSVDQLVVLVNNGSASASEIIAAAVQDWDKALVVGEKTYGKGLVQEQYPLGNGGALRLTVARYFTPSGRYIQTPYETETFKQDTTPKYSKEKERPLKNQGGVDPDILISSNQSLFQLFAENDSLIARRLFAFMDEHCQVEIDDSNKKYIKEKWEHFVGKVHEELSQKHVEEVLNMDKLNTRLYQKMLSYDCESLKTFALGYDEYVAKAQQLLEEGLQTN